MTLVSANCIRFDDSDFRIRSNGTNFGREDLQPSGIRGHARFPTRDVAEVWFDYDLPGQSIGEQFPDIFESLAETRSEVFVVLQSDNRNFSGRGHGLL
jgi:hypothetical protein